MSEPIKVLAMNDAAVSAPEIDLPTLSKVFEAALLTAPEPLTVADLKRLSVAALENVTVEKILQTIVDKYRESGVELTCVASGWRFRARPEMQIYLDRLDPPKMPRYSRPVMETLAIIAYRQPVTRGDIEEIRGVTVTTQVIKTLESRNWIEVVGMRDTPGRPALYATTKKLLDDLNLRSLKELPDLSEVGELMERPPLEVATPNAELHPTE